MSIFSISPIEASIWNIAVAVQVGLCHLLFKNKIFYALCIISFVAYFLFAMNKVKEGVPADQMGTRVFVRLIFAIIGLNFLISQTSGNFILMSGSEISWKEIAKKSHPGLENSSNGLYWYSAFQKGAVEISRFITTGVNRIFDDKDYEQSPQILYKALAAASSAAIDDPKSLEYLNALAKDCSDPAKAKIMTKNDPITYYLNLEGDYCQETYLSFKEALSLWADQNTTDELSRFTGRGINSLFNMSFFKNKQIASALASHVKLKTGLSVAGVHSKATRIDDGEFFYNVQRAIGTSAKFAWLDKLMIWKKNSDLYGKIARNEMATLYNDFYSLTRSVKGYVKAFICFYFLFASAALMLGFYHIFLKWLGLLLLDALYEPISCLTYNISKIFFLNDEISEIIPELAKSPFLLAGAEIIDMRLHWAQMGYYVAEMIIMSVFVWAVIKGNWAIMLVNFKFDPVARVVGMAQMTKFFKR